MDRRFFLISLAPVSVCACAPARTFLLRGETASYAAFNPSDQNGFEMGRLEAADKKLLLDERLRIPALPPGAPGWSGGGPLMFGDTGHRVPDRVKISWRLPPREGQARYKGDLVGPFELDLRSRIPDEVLGAATKHGRILQIAVSVGVVPILVRWRLIEPNPDGRGHREMSRGGDW